MRRDAATCRSVAVCCTHRVMGVRLGCMRRNILVADTSMLRHVDINNAVCIALSTRAHRSIHPSIDLPAYPPPTNLSTYLPMHPSIYPSMSTRLSVAARACLCALWKGVRADNAIGLDLATPPGSPEATARRLMISAWTAACRRSCSSRGSLRSAIERPTQRVGEGPAHALAHSARCVHVEMAGFDLDA